MITRSTRGSAAAACAAAAQGVVGFELAIGPHGDARGGEGFFEQRELRAEGAGSIPSPVLYPGHRALRNDSMTWSVATPMCVAPRRRNPSMDVSTPRTTAISRPCASRGGR